MTKEFTEAETNLYIYLDHVRAHQILTTDKIEKRFKQMIIRAVRSVGYHKVKGVKQNETE